jgi:uncharacterized membrane protein YidH (DUF202 family)
MLENLSIAIAVKIAAFVPAAWDLGSFLQNATATLKQWGGYLIMLMGVVAVVIGVVKAVTGLMSHGKKDTNWLVVAVLIIVGGALLVGGWGFVATISGGGQKTILDLGSTMLPLLPFGG